MNALELRGFVLRVHFTAGDMARTRVADGPDPLWESVLILHKLQTRNQEPELADWRRRVLQRGASSLRLLLPLVPARGYFPDFLTPPEGSAGFDAGLEALLRTPRRQLRSQMERLSLERPLCSWARSVADGSAPVMRILGSALEDFRRIALDTSWRGVRSGIEADRTWRARTQWYSGTEAMLQTFEPSMHWRPPVLECDYPVDRDLHLDGRGLLMVPSYFCRRTPVALADSALPPTLTYPARGTVQPEPRPDTAEQATGEYLARLLGRTRAAVLQSVGGNCTTTELAGRAGVSISSASEHAAVLCGSGLILSTRERNTVRHTLTPVGLALLDSRPHHPDPRIRPQEPHSRPSAGPLPHPGTGPAAH